MKYKKDDKVFLKTLKREGVIAEVLKTGEYQVASGSFKLTLKESDLDDIGSDLWKKYSKSAKPKQYSVPKISVDRAPGPSIDLHGKRVEDALRMVEDYINKAIIAEMDKVEIVHGLGTGALLQAIHNYLKKQSVVKHFKLDENNPGTTWVYF